MEINLKKLTLVNFKGIKSLTVNFSKNTNIGGKNAAGKTTIFDAFLWLLFDKDSAGRSDFNVKTLNELGEEIHKIDHEVNGLLDIDGEDVVIKKILREKWTKRRGETNTVFDGHETQYYWNDVPVSQSEYKKKISGIVEESLFRMITDPCYFNNMKWQDRRSVLIKIAGSIDDSALLRERNEFDTLLKHISGKTIDEFKKEIASKKKKLKDELQEIPARIDEVKRNTPEAPDYTSIEKQIAEKTERLAQIEKELYDVSEANKAAQDIATKRYADISDKKRQLLEIEHKIKVAAKNSNNEVLSKIDGLRERLSQKTSKQSSLILEKARLVDEGLVLTKDIENLRKEWEIENTKTISFSESEFNCPTCHRALDNVEEKKEELIKNFNKGKLVNLSNINQKGKSKKANLEALEKNISAINQSITEITNEISVLEKELSGVKTPEPVDVENLIATNSEHLMVRTAISKLESIGGIPLKPNSELLSEKNTVGNEINVLKSKLSIKSAIDASNERISQLYKQESTIAQEIANLEKTEHTIQEYTKAKINLIESSINTMFGHVKFKMFETQINGQEVECCDCMVAGVPWADANNAAKINAGLDIINTLDRHYKVFAPIFIDNAEAVNTLIDMDCQIIKLIVTNTELTIN